MKNTNEFTMTIGTVNGSGSQSANNILVKTFFHMGIPVTGKNFFPSNIAGLPTAFSIRLSAKGHLSRQGRPDLGVGMNAVTLVKEQMAVQPGGVFIYNSDLKAPLFQPREDITVIPIPFAEIVKEASDSIKLKKLLTNIVYVGVLSQLLKVDRDILTQTIHKNFSDKPKVIDVNLKAVEAGWNYAQEHLQSFALPFQVQRIANGNQNKVLMDGNTASALGLLFGGCSFLSWYPITPSSSVAEKFYEYASKYRKDAENKNQFAVVQAEDELAAISMVIGAGWTGARAVTPTSGPGLSLMAEAAGLSYFAEVPAVLWNVQRVGPSTGLPTRTLQGDVLASYYLSHGDTKHVVLFPSDPAECFEFGQTCFDLAERLQTFVVVLSDLDLGMNYWISDDFEYPQKPFDRGKVYREKELEEHPHYARYEDVDRDGITYRTLPGTHHERAAYFTRGTAHDDKAFYSEDHENFKHLMDRLNMKFETAKKQVPKPIKTGHGTTGILAYGTSDLAIKETLSLFKEKGQDLSYMRVRALPLGQEVYDYIQSQQRVYLVEQNRDGQMKQILLSQWPELGAKVQSVLHYDGLPLSAEYVMSEIQKYEER